MATRSRHLLRLARPDTCGGIGLGASMSVGGAAMSQTVASASSAAAFLIKGVAALRASVEARRAARV